MSFNATSPSGSYTTAAGFLASGGTNAAVIAKTGALNTAFGGSTYLGYDLSLSAASGVSYNITDVSLGSRQTGTGPTTLSLYDGTDGFTSTSNLLSSVTVATTSTWTADDFAGISVSLPNDGSTVSFRIYGSGGTGNAGTGNWRTDDLAVALMSIPTPEPSTLALVTVGGLSCLFRLRHRR